jgi:hypothetical protein
MISLFTPSLPDLSLSYLSIHIPPISPSISLPLQTISLVSLVILTTKTKRIAERSAIMTGRQDDRQEYDRQRTLDKYMIDY